MSDMELKPLPGTDGYFVDCKRQEAYSFRNGMLRKLKARTKYKKISLKLDGKTVGSTIYRMIYSAQHGIDLRRIPSDLCVTMTGGGWLWLTARRSRRSRHVNDVAGRILTTSRRSASA